MKSVEQLLAELNLGQSNLFSFAEDPEDLYINKKVVSIYLEQVSKKTQYSHISLHDVLAICVCTYSATTSWSRRTA